MLIDNILLAMILSGLALGVIAIVSEFHRGAPTKAQPLKLP
jgi:hypothetical protein